MRDRRCSIEGCDKPARSRSAEWCKMHYHRWYRHGSTDACARGVATRSDGSRYRLITATGHPLDTACGRVYEHRVVLFDAIGEGPHACHWCGIEVHWFPSDGDKELQPDHLNSIRDDNRPENLVPSCRGCNTTRGSQSRADALRAAGFWSNNDTRARLRNQRRVARVE